MTRSSDAHRTGFTVRCACGNVFHSDDTHLGRRIRCRCGRTVVIERPVDTATSAASKPSGSSSSSSQRRRRKTAGFRETPSGSDALAASITQRLARMRPRWRSFSERAALFVTLALHDFVHPWASRRWATRVAWFALFVAGAAWFMLAVLSERFVPATLLAYGPRAVVLLPIAVAAPWAAMSARRALWPLAVALWIALVPVMGLRLSPTTFARALPVAPGSDEVRVLSFNVRLGNSLAPRLTEMLREYAPDIVAFQECGERLWAALQAEPGWTSYKSDGLCTASRFPVEPIETMLSPDDQRIGKPLRGGYGNLAVYRVNARGVPLVFVNLHLPTARHGLDGMLSSGDDGLVSSDPLDALGAMARGATGVVSEEADAQFRSNRLAREIASERASMHAWNGGSLRGTTLPVVVAGDFNLPVESTIYRRHWSAFTNAFEVTGNGMGWTKREGRLLRIRIDHVLLHGASLRPRRAVVQRDWYSDHLPVVADIALR